MVEKSMYNFIASKVKRNFECKNILFVLRWACDILFLTFDFNFKEREVVIEIMIKEANNYGE